MKSQFAEVSLRYQSEMPVSEMPEITSPQKAEKVLRSIWDPDTIQLKEDFLVLLLNNSKRCLGWRMVYIRYIGGLNS